MSLFGGKALEQADATGEAFIEVEFAAHGCFGDFGYLFADAGEFGQFVDDFALDEGGIHVEDEETAGGAMGGVVLEGNVEGEICGGDEEFGAEVFFFLWNAFEGELEDGIEGLLGWREAGGELLGICNLETVGSKNRAYALLLRISDNRAQEGEDE